MMRRWFLFMLLAVMPSPVLAGGVVAELSAHDIAITAGFTGVDLIVFGSMDQPSDVAVVVEGPQGKATVRRKSHLFGLWINTDSFVFDEVPGYYAIATSKPAGQLASPDVIAANGLDFNHFRFPSRSDDAAAVDLFRHALISRREVRGFYRDMPLEVSTVSDRLFRATFPLPANVPIGKYKVHVYLLRGGQITASETLPLDVDEVGLGATIFEAARIDPFLYAGAALLMAIAMGGGGAWLFQRMS